MDESRKGFEEKFPRPAHWIEYCSARNKYYCRFSADSQANEYQSMWLVWQEQQKKIGELKEAFQHLAEMNNKSISIEYDLFDKGWNQASKQTVINIHRLTGIGDELLK